MKLLICIILALVTLSCTKKSDDPLPDMERYESDGTLMVNICKKFSEEPDIKKLHSAALAIQSARVVLCSNYNDVCSIYGRCISEVIQASKDGEISASERTDMKSIATKLKAAFAEGKSKLSEDLKNTK